jgi:DNA ligase 1
MQLEDVVLTSKRVGEERGRLAKIRLLSECLGRMEPDDVRIGVAYLSGELPQGRIGVGWASVKEVMTGSAAEAASLTLSDADTTFTQVAGESGAGSAGRRMAALHALFQKATEAERHFLSRLLIGELRQGAEQGVMAEAIAKAASVPSSEVRRALMVAPSAGVVAHAALTEGSAGLARFKLELMSPVQPMLAETAEDTTDALAQLERAALEYKLDGARVQVHRVDDEVKVFSRQANDVTSRVPELVSLVKSLPVKRLVLDGEAIALRPDGRPLPFQVTMKRFGRRSGAGDTSQGLALSSFFFDILHADGEDTIDKPTSERFELMEQIVPANVRIPRIVTASPDEAKAFLEGAMAAGHEGVMAKSLIATYEAGRRGSSWLKVKPTHTLDLVVLAVEVGSGRRSKWLSNIHLGARDPKTNGFVMLGKTFKGMTDAMLEWQTKRFRELEIGQEGHVVHVRPEQVVEIAIDGVQTSSHYPGGMALRFARVKRYRSDKSASDADTIDTVRAILTGKS